MFQLIRKKLEEVTPLLAGKFLDANIYEGQRPKRKKQITALTNAIDGGVFLTGSIAVAHQGWNGGDLMLANGQHQCEAVIATGKSIAAVVEEYACKTPEDFAVLYRQFDNNAVRSLSEIAVPEAAALNLKWSKSLISKVLSAVSFLEGHIGMHKNERVKYLKKYIREGNFVHEILDVVSACESKHITRSPVVAAMIVTYRKDHADAEEFWEEVRDGENLKANSASLRLRNYLLSTSISFGRGVNAGSLNESASVREMYAKCIVAWNAYRSGGTTSLKYFPGKDIPKVL
jgi:hypothetical protein